MPIAVKRKVIGDRQGTHAVVTSRWERDMERLMDEIGDDVLDKVFPAVERGYGRNAPIDTGELRQGLRHQATVQDLPDRRVWRLWTRVSYAPFVEYGVAQRGVDPRAVLAEEFRKKRRSFGTRVRRLFKRYFPPAPRA